MARNPFTPTFGVSPPMLVGRDDVILDFSDGLEEGVGSPMRALVVTGARGSGKTVLLNALEDEARGRGWRVVSLTAREGMLRELVRTRLPEHLNAELGEERVSSLTGFHAGALGFQLGVDRNVVDSRDVEPDLRAQMFALADATHERGAGLLLTVDEVHRSAAGDLRVISQEVQHAFREDREVAMVLAGLPGAVSDMLSTDVMTVIRRAERYTMGAVGASEVREALDVPFLRAQRAVEQDALEAAVQGTQGYPFLIQSVGYETWRAARGSELISLDHARQGTRAAVRRIGRLVHEPSLATLSNTDRSFLTAMAVDDGPSRMKEISLRLNINAQYANVYRSRLIAAEIITATSRGHVDFTIPYLRDHLRDHVAAYTLDVAGDDLEPQA